MCEKWTHYKSIRAQYPGLISIELWNRANRGKLAIMQNKDGGLEMTKSKGVHGKERLKNNPLFPYKFITCPNCGKPMLGSSPRGKLGKPHPTSHCARNHKYFGVPKKVFDTTVEAHS